jgi:regulator of replication initiation timing
MTKELSIEEKFDVLFEHIGYLQSEVPRLTNDNLCLKNEVLFLRNHLAKYENPKNSSNSSKPPSSAYPKQQKTQSLREPSEKKPGSQSGHEGTTLKIVSTPDITKEHFSSYCTCCGEDLSAQAYLFRQTTRNRHSTYNTNCNRTSVI